MYSNLKKVLKNQINSINSHIKNIEKKLDEIIFIYKDELLKTCKFLLNPKGIIQMTILNLVIMTMRI
jgi:hypothetical protein